MKNSRVSAIALVVAAYLITSVGAQGVAAESAGQACAAKTIALRPGPAVPIAETDKLSGCAEQVKANYQTITAHFTQRNSDYVSKARRDSETLDDAIKKHGLARVVRVGNKAHADCLSLALERTNKQMSAEDFDSRTKEIARQYYTDMQKINVSAPIDFTKPVVIQASHKKIILDTLLYEKLLGIHPKPDGTADYGDLLASAFSAKEYSEQMAKQLAVIDGIYDSLLEARVGFRGLFAKSGIDKSRKFRKEYCREQAKKDYAGKLITRVAIGKRAKPSGKAGSNKVHLSVVVPGK